MNGAKDLHEPLLITERNEEEPPLKKIALNVSILAVCFCFGTTVLFSHAATTSIAANYLINETSLATLPFSLFIAVSAVGIPLTGNYMSRHGYRKGFMLGVTMGFFGALLSTFGLLLDNGKVAYALLCLSMIPQGGAYGVIHYYRHVSATELSPQKFATTAISIVVTGGVVAAILGPQISMMTVNLIPNRPYAGTYVLHAVIYTLHFFVLWVANFTPVSAQTNGNSTSRQLNRSLKELMTIPKFWIAILSGTTAHYTMTGIMTITPVAMVAYGFTFDDAATVIQGHVLGMFLPSLGTGYLSKYVDVQKINVCGILVLICGVFLFLIDTLAGYMVSLVVIGLGWNFAFISSTSLLSQVYTPAEKFKVQSFNDFLVFGTAALTAFSVGGIFNSWGIHVIILGSGIILAVIFVVDGGLLVYSKVQPPDHLNKLG